MRELEVFRLYRTDKLTLGIFYIDGRPQFITMELPWKDNEQKVSCIPEGEYFCKRRKASLEITAELGEAFEVQGVPNRSDILIHVANYPNQIEGCIAIGMRWGWELEGVFDSRIAFKNLMERLKGINDCKIKIATR